ncbi:penicillin acylase family protein [Meiothermus ruber]|uniref:Peptidase S45 penicillin amidase n=1 Tax=Meiothermus ruber (strain ATCC 35948 / DSM 1279 / VKM B-1258 / 21) TaxID=504728 RepID=D3PTW4_MEIRD|nr:penicillin acylase family protein [Meiothermus ruber]ADD28897.1 peptidase S45 penicillin amidase [Meiothermus ruber DSM 1279]AGK05654.1 peptidase S45 penicillin amidase [Meiothermus ruber DSM 1279]MCL6530871.1 penicillin acylase family protein [Meiothermus ruber]GAO75812.1 peptidase S45 penicillin amidase [Meiothermus ruber H328]
MHRRLLWLMGLLVLASCVPVNQVQQVQGLVGPVRITFDRWGVPHIRAQASDMDVFFAQGYVHARDRLFQMELGRRAAQGRLAEILGSGAIEQDRFFRTWGFYRAAQAALPNHSEFTRRALEAYAAGVNQFIREGHLPLPFALLGFTPEPWTPADTLAWGKLQSYDLGQVWQDEIDNTFILNKVGLEGFNDLRGAYPQGWPTILQPEDLRSLDERAQSRRVYQPAALSPDLLERLERVAAFSRQLSLAPQNPDQGSNNWVLSGARTTTGKPMLANDPHLRLQNPALWYIADLRGPTYHAIGATIPGVPGVFLGRNDRVAWGATNVRPDVMDLFVLDLEGGSYRTPLGLVPLRVRQETIRVRGADPVTITVRESEYGPVISDLGPAFLRPGLTAGAAIATEKQAVAVRWTGLDPQDTTLDAYLGMNRAQNAEEFRQALRRYVAPMQNFVYADVEGTIGYFAPGWVPIRDWDGRFPASASKGQQWKGYLPFERLPQVVNPKEGFVASANNRVLPHGGPDISSYTTEVFRAQRIRELILATPRANLEDMARWQGDTYSIIARELLPGLLALQPQSEAARRLQNAVRNWDLRAELDSVGATAFAFYYREISRMLEDELGLRYPPVPYTFIKTLREEGRWCQDARAGIRNCAQFMAQALEKAGAELERRLGPDPSGWQWGRLHQASLTSPLASAPLVGGLFNRTIPTPGSMHTVNVANYNQDTFLHTSGASLRTLFDLSDPDNSRIIYPMGQSADLFSPHFDDLLWLWRDKQYIPLSTRPADWGPTWTLELRP